MFIFFLSFPSGFIKSLSRRKGAGWGVEIGVGSLENCDSYHATPRMRVSSSAPCRPVTGIQGSTVGSREEAGASRSITSLEMSASPPTFPARRPTTGSSERISKTLGEQFLFLPSFQAHTCPPLPHNPSPLGSPSQVCCLQQKDKRFFFLFFFSPRSNCFQTGLALVSLTSCD